MLSMGIEKQPLLVIPTLLGSDFGVLGHLWSQNDGILMSLLRLTATSNCFSHPHWTYTKCLSTLICCPWAYGSNLKQLYQHYLGHILGFWVTCGVKMMSLIIIIIIIITQRITPCYLLDVLLMVGADAKSFGIVITSLLRLTASSNCFLHPHQTYTKCLSTLICCPRAHSSSLKHLYSNFLAQILGYQIVLYQFVIKLI